MHVSISVLSLFSMIPTHISCMSYLFLTIKTRQWSSKSNTNLNTCMREREMAYRLQKRMTLRRKLHILRTLTNSKSVKKNSIIMDAFLHIYKLKLKLEAIKRQYLYLMNHIQEVKVEKVGEEFRVTVRCKKGQDMLVSILGSFEEMGLNVLQARVSCNCFLSIEAIVGAQDKGIDEREIEKAVQNAIGKQDVFSPLK